MEGYERPTHLYPDSVRKAGKSVSIMWLIKRRKLADFPSLILVWSYEREVTRVSSLTGQQLPSMVASEQDSHSRNREAFRLQRRKTSRRWMPWALLHSSTGQLLILSETWIRNMVNVHIYSHERQDICFQSPCYLKIKGHLLPQTVWPSLIQVSLVPGSTSGFHAATLWVRFCLQAFLALLNSQRTTKA